MMTRCCGFKGCNAPEVSCTNGEVDLADCPHWQATEESIDADTEADVSVSVSGEFRFPWTGNAMGASDLGYLAGAATTRLVMLAGPADAGKTSLLAAIYLLMARGISAEDVRFAGSLTLEGWENIASNLRWSSPQGPSFPAHTSSGAGRHPGLLHLSLRMPTKTCEFLAADAPGEWFTEWAINKHAQQAEGVRWLADCSDVLLVIADSQALVGAQRGQARKGLIDLLRRVGAERLGRPVALVWTKCDVVVSTEMTTAIQEAANRALLDFVEFHVSMHPAEDAAKQHHGQGIIELLRWILTTSSRVYEFPPDEVPEGALLRLFRRA